MISFFRKKPDPRTHPLSPAEVLDTISRMQSELDRLKLAITHGHTATASQRSASAVTGSLAEVEARSGSVRKNDNEKIVEGVFDGEKMIGADGEEYDVPANYASKSKLVEGDILKLTVNNLGAFVYKQIKPIDRQRLIGRLEQDQQNLQFQAVAEGKKWKLLTASVTYYKGQPGDEVIFLVPADGESRWAAVENIV